MTLTLVYLWKKVELKLCQIFRDRFPIKLVKTEDEEEMGSKERMTESKHILLLKTIAAIMLCNYS